MIEIVFEKLLHWTVTAIAVLIAIFFIGMIIMVSVFHYEYKHGINWKGMSNKYYTAVTSGDGEQAILWAKKSYAYKIQGKKGISPDPEFLIAQAYELDGQIDMAILWYGIDAETKGNACWCEVAEKDHSTTHFGGRIFYKQGKKEKAFEAYCHYGEYSLKQHTEKLASERDNIRHQALGDIRAPIIMANAYYEMRLTPFVDYKDFLDFMEEEYAKLGEPSEFLTVMELFRAIDSEVDEKRLSRSGASDDLDRMRETIRQERMKKSMSSLSNRFQ